MIPHMHKYKFECKSANYHKHVMAGYTENMLGINSLHVHQFHGVTSHNGHVHSYTGITGIPVKTKNGHIHKIEGVSENIEQHEHQYLNYTFEDVEYISDGIIKGAYIL